MSRRRFLALPTVSFLLWLVAAVLLIALFPLPASAKPSDEEFYGPFALPSGHPFGIRISYNDDGTCVLGIMAMRIDGESGKILETFWMATTLPVTLCSRPQAPGQTPSQDSSSSPTFPGYRS